MEISSWVISKCRYVILKDSTLTPTLWNITSNGILQLQLLARIKLMCCGSNILVMLQQWDLWGGAKEEGVGSNRPPDDTYQPTRQGAIFVLFTTHKRYNTLYFYLKNPKAFLRVLTQSKGLIPEYKVRYLADHCERVP